MANVGTAAAGKTLIGAGNGASPTYADIGTNSGLAANGVVLAQGNSPFTVASPSLPGTILMSNGAGSDPSFQNGGSFIGNTITGDSGGALSPTAGNWNLFGSGSITTVGSGSTLTTQLTGLTNHAVLVGAGTTTITKVGPTATAGQVLQSAGASADPAFSTATYPSTATGTGTILRADGTNWSPTTSTYPNTNAINTLLYASAANVMSALPTVNRASLSTNSTGVPTWLALTDGQIVIGSTAGSPAAANISQGTGITITNASNSITVAVNGSVVGQTITGNTGGALSPTAGNWNISGSNSALTGYSPWTSGSGSTLTVNMPGTVKWVVNATSGLGTHTTIQAAITAAASGDDIFITPGTYTENLTLKVGVNLLAHTTDAFTPTVTISGTCTLTTAGTVTMSGIRLQTNSAALIAVTGSAASILNLYDCYLNCTNNTGITFSTSSSSAVINIKDCQGDIGTTGISLFSHSSAGTLNIVNTRITNTGNATTASTCSAGAVNISYCDLIFPLTTSSTGACGIGYSNFSTANTNTTALTLGGSGIQNIKYTGVQSGTASAISISATAVVQLCEINSTNTNAITGAGTITYSGLVFTGSSNTINTTTQTGSGTLQGSKNTAPAAGFLGEQISSAVTGVSLSSGTPKSLTSISLTAGVWDVTALGSLFSTANVASAGVVGISATNNTFEGNEGDKKGTLNPNASNWNNFCIAIPQFRVTLSATTTYYVVAQLNFSSSTATGAGRITATRVG